jgi:hypothetical protein
MARQGRSLSAYEVRTIQGLLNATDMSIGSIAQRMGCSSGAVASINRKFQIRNYQGRRSNWIVETGNNVMLQSQN